MINTQAREVPASLSRCLANDYLGAFQGQAGPKQDIRTLLTPSLLVPESEEG